MSDLDELAARWPVGTIVYHADGWQGTVAEAGPYDPIAPASPIAPSHVAVIAYRPVLFVEDETGDGQWYRTTVLTTERPDVVKTHPAARPARAHATGRASQPHHRGRGGRQ